MADDEGKFQGCKDKFLVLRAHMKKEQFSKCIDVCDEILNQLPDDVDALKVKISSLVALDRNEEALIVCKNIKELSFEKAYCLYRLNKLAEAMHVCSTIPEPKAEHVVNLEAQTYYRLQQYNLAVDRYSAITSSEAPSDLETDLLSNVYAAYTSAGRGKEVLEAYPVDDEIVGDSFELMFNTVCALISGGQLAVAASALEQTEALCREVLTEDGLSEEDILQEMTNIQLQKSFVGILSNRSSDKTRQTAVEECLAILRNNSGNKKKKNHEMLAVAANNLAVLRGDKDLPDSLRRLRTITAESEEKLSLNQLMEIRYNRCILQLHMRKMDDTVRALDELDQLYGASTLQSIVLRASIAASVENYDQSDEILLTEKKRLEALGTDADIVAKISIVYVQTLIARQRYGDALSCLDEISTLKYTPAGVSATYYLKALQQTRQGQSIQKALDAIASEYLVEVATALDECSDVAYSAASGTQTLLFIAQILEQHQRHQASSNVLQILLRCGSDDLDAAVRLTVIAHLVSAMSHEDPEEAERYASSLTQIETGDYDANDLETKDIPRMKKLSGVNSAVASDNAEGDAREKAVEARRVKKCLARRAARKAAYLKKLEEEGKYDPARPSKPDAERWIPAKQRAHNKRGRKNWGKFVGGQGSGDGAQKDMLKLDAMARSQMDKPVNVGTVISSSSSGPGGNKKKKAKGKKK